MRIEHIAMYVNDLEKTKEFFVKYFNATSNKGYHNQTTDFRSYLLPVFLRKTPMRHETGALGFAI